MKNPYLLFDAGGTLAFPDFKYLSQEASNFGIRIKPDKLFQIHCQMILDLDCRTQASGHLEDPFPNGYPRTIFKDFVTDGEILENLVCTVERRNTEKSLWTTTRSWIIETLQQLKSLDYPMSVISNSDGRVEQILTELELRPFFDRIFDSHTLGVSKPDQRIFLTALDTLGLNLEDAIYIGDVFYIDVWGANQAGLGCIHLDPHNLYSNWPGVHLPTIAQIPTWLSEIKLKQKQTNIFPAIDIKITY